MVLQYLAVKGFSNYIFYTGNTYLASSQKMRVVFVIFIECSTEKSLRERKKKSPL